MANQLFYYEAGRRYDLSGVLWSYPAQLPGQTYVVFRSLDHPVALDATRFALAQQDYLSGATQVPSMNFSRASNSGQVAALGFF